MRVRGVCSRSDRCLDETCRTALWRRDGLLTPPDLPGLSWQAARSSVNEHGYPNARMKHIKQEIFAFDVVDVAIVGQQPFRGPGIQENKRITRVNKSGLIWDDCGRPNHSFDRKRVRSAKVGLELRIRNASALTCRP